MMNKMMGGKKPAGMKKTMSDDAGKMGRMGKKTKGPKAVPAIGMAYGGMATKKAK